MSNKNNRLALAAIIIVGLYFRLIHLRAWFHFEMDEEVIAWKVREFVLTGKPFLIGGSTPYGFHLGPAFYYLSSIPLFFSRLDPIGWGYFSAIAGGVGIICAYYFGKKIYSVPTGLIISALWAFSFRQIFFDRHWWPMVLNPLMGLLAVWSWRGIITSHEKKWWLLLGITLSFAWQADLSNLILFLGTSAISLILLIKKRLKKNATGILWMLGLLGISFMPLVFFEMRHPGANLGKISEYTFTAKQINRDQIIHSLLLPAQVSGSMLIPTVFYSGNLLDFYSWDKAIASQRVNKQHWLITVIGFGLLSWPIAMWFFKKRNVDLAWSILILSGWIGILMFGVMGGDLFDFYLAPLYSVPLMTGAVILNRLMDKRGILGMLGVLGCLGILVINLRTYSKVYHPQGIEIKEDTVKWSISQVGENNFGLDVLSKNHRYNGVRYLYMLYGKEPIISYMDDDIAWLYDTRELTVPTKFIVISTIGDLTSQQREKMGILSQNSEKREQIGVFDTIILNNEKQDYQIN